MTRKFTAYEKHVITSLYQLPKEVRKPFVREILSEIFDSKEEYDEYFKAHPNANPDNHSIKGDTEEQDLEDKEEKSKFKALKEKATESLKSVLEHTKEFKKKLGDIGKPGSMGDLVETLAALMSAILVPDQGGTDYLKEVTERVGAAEEDEIEAAMTQLKAAELAAFMNPEVAERMEEEIGLKPFDEVQIQEDLKKLKEGLAGEEPLDEEVRGLLADMLGNMEGSRVKFLQEFLKEDGSMDNDRLKEFLKKGVEAPS
jgi:hypothetical protein